MTNETTKATETTFDSLGEVCVYFDDRLKDYTTWTHVQKDLGIEGVEILHKQYGIWNKVVTGNNIGRFEGTDSSQVLKVRDDVEQNGVDPNQPCPVVEIDDGDLITGAHREEASGQLGIPGWMFQYVRITAATQSQRNWIKKRLSKALNNTRVFNQLNNSSNDIREHIKYGLNHGQLKTQSQIEDEIRFMSNNSLSKVQQKTIIAEMVSYISQSGLINKVKMARYRTYTDDTFADFVATSKDPYVENVLKDKDSHNFFFNTVSGTTIYDALKAAQKISLTDPKPYLNIQASVEIPSKQQSLDEKRQNVDEQQLTKLDNLSKFIRKYHAEFQCDAWRHPDSKHRFLAQDWENEDVENGEFISW